MEKVTTFLINKRFPNYIFLILTTIILILIIVIIAVASSGSESSSNTEEEDDQTLTAWEKYKKAEKYLYIWEYYTPDYIIKMCQEHHFTRVYLSIGCIAKFWDKYYKQGKFPVNGEIGSLDYETFIKKLNDINVEVELVTFLENGDPNDFSSVERADTVAKLP